MATGGWSGFTEEDLRRIRLENETKTVLDDETAEARTFKQAKLNGSMEKKQSTKGRKAAKLYETPGTVNVISKEEMLSMHLSANVSETTKQNGGTTIKLRLKQDGHSVEVIEGKETSEKSLENENELDKVRVNVYKELEKVCETVDISNCVEIDSHVNHKMSLEEFEWRQKMIEEQNAKRRALLTKALADRKKKTIAETEKLSYIQQELEKLNSLVTNDIAILRKHIDIASMEFSEVQKRYEKAEKEFVEAKLELFRKMERKEQLTEHLCTIIEQNELRKAKKLADLMYELEMDSLVDDQDMVEGHSPVLTRLCLMSEVNYVTMFKSPTKVSEISIHPAVNDNNDCGNDDSESKANGTPRFANKPLTFTVSCYWISFSLGYILHAVNMQQAVGVVKEVPPGGAPLNYYFLDEPNYEMETTTSIPKPLFERSATVNVYREGYYPPKSTAGPMTDTGWFVLGITQSQLPILVGTAAGVMLLLITLVGLILWKCCQYPKGKDDQYSFPREEEGVSSNSSTKRTSSESVVFIGHVKHSNCSSHSYLNHCSDVSPLKTPNHSISRSQSAPLKPRDSSNWCVRTNEGSKKRPLSQPLRTSPVDINFKSQLITEHQPHHLGNTGSKLPDIPEIRLCSTESLDSQSQASIYSTYDYPYCQSHSHHHQCDPMSATMKTRSLPTWVRSRPRPLSTEDDISELYAKVNLNKRRKNRMRNDSAAAIALNKSRSQLMHFPYSNDDTVSLVDHEAVVIYDERTAL
ncbi:hypothetical protein CHUAL_009563 [Chamberlinius hualienensis]